MKGIKLVLAAGTLISTSLVGMALAVNPAQATSMSFDQQIISREASEGPRGFDNERPGDKHRGRRGKAIEQFDQLAREASEGPRGFDNERPGDKHRGRRGKAIEQFDQLAREASEGPRGFDNERPGDKHRGRRGKAIEHLDHVA